MGNPPFTGAKYLREQQGSAYVEALWAAHPTMNESADLVMYWWDHAADLLTRKGTALRRFGLVTTNSLTQVFQSRVVERHLNGKHPVSLVFAVPDHPWTKATREAAAVRIAMTVAEAGLTDGTLLRVVGEDKLETDQPEIETRVHAGRINANLTIGVDVTSAKQLVANEGLCSPGVKLHGAGFIVSETEARLLGLGSRIGLERHVRPYRNGRDLTARSRGKLVIDLFGLTEAQVRTHYPEVFQHLLSTVKVDRVKQVQISPTRDALEYLRRWWVFGKPRQELRPALGALTRYIATSVTSKHRIFAFLESGILPDDALMVFAVDNTALLSALSSSVFKAWFNANSAMLEDRPRFIKSRCFDPFPFPDPTAELHTQLAEAGEELDRFRKERLAAHPHLSLTDLYNVLEKVRAGAELTPKDERIKTEGLVLTLQSWHDEIDRLTFAAYGWPADLDEEAILASLVALNAERAAEEARGLVRWLRPDYQIPRFGMKGARGEQASLDTPEAAGRVRKPAFPRDAVPQTAEVMAALAASGRPSTAAELAARYTGGARVEAAVLRTLEALARLGYAAPEAGGTRFALRRAA